MIGRPALELGAAVRAGEVSPTELVEACLARIAAVDGELNAFVTVDADGAREQARAAERALAAGAPVGPLHGVPIAVKDLTPTRGLRTTFGSRAFADHVPDADATSVANMRAAGLVILGKTNTCEFGTLAVTESELLGPCRNPFDPSRNAGGSSGGSACALAAEMVPLAHGTDAGGSVRVPAGLCGVAAFKPSRGRISLAPRAGERLLGWATEGAIARTIADAAALLDVMCGYVLGDPYWQAAPQRPFLAEAGTAPGRLRVALCTTPASDVAVDPEVAAAVRAAGQALEELGHVVEEAAPAWDDEVTSAMVVVRSTIAAYYGVEDPSLLDECNRALMDTGAQTSALDYVRATVVLQRAARRVTELWADFDVLLTPTSPFASVPNSGGANLDALRRSGELTSFTRWFNLTGQPAAALPFWWSRDGFPLSVHLVGRPGGDVELLRVCGQLEGRSGARRLGAAVPARDAQTNSKGAVG